MNATREYRRKIAVEIARSLAMRNAPTDYIAQDAVRITDELLARLHPDWDPCDAEKCEILYVDEERSKS